MQIALKCDISLSKKIRGLLQNGSSIVLTVDSINSGKGEGLLVLTGINNGKIDLSELIDKETSIMITPTEESKNLAQSVSNIYNNDTRQNPGVSQVFNPQYSPQQRDNKQRDSIDRMASIIPPEQGANNRAYYTQDELEVPKALDYSRKERFGTYIKNYQEFLDAVEAAKDKNSKIRVEDINESDSIHTKRQKALLMEQKQVEESIGIDAYVVNEKCASLTINDLDLDLPLMMPRNLGNISAKRLSSSRELWNLLRKDFVRLISPNEADHLVKNASTMNKTYVPELEVYDSRYDAREGIESIYDDRNDNRKYSGRSFETNSTILDLEEDMDGETEEMSNLRMARSGGRQLTGRSQPSGSVTSLSGDTRTSFHGSGNSDEVLLNDLYSGDDWRVSEKHVGRESRRNSAGVKTVASRHSRRR